VILSSAQITEQLLLLSGLHEENTIKLIKLVMLSLLLLHKRYLMTVTRYFAEKAINYVS